MTNSEHYHTMSGLLANDWETDQFLLVEEQAGKHLLWSEARDLDDWLFTSRATAPEEQYGAVCRQLVTLYQEGAKRAENARRCTIARESRVEVRGANKDELWVFFA